MMTETIQTITIAIWVATSVTVCGVLAVKPKPRKSSVPDDAATIGPDGYMQVWASDRRINMRFRNMPNVTVTFDRRVVGDLASWLEGVKT